jgi:hypothetical protein
MAAIMEMYFSTGSTEWNQTTLVLKTRRMKAVHYLNATVPMERLVGIEPTTLCFEGIHSIQMSYRRA